MYRLFLGWEEPTRVRLASRRDKPITRGDENDPAGAEEMTQ